MAVRQYKWRTSTRYQSDTSLSYGVSPASYDSWQTANVGEQSLPTITYWYRDANVSGPGGFTDANSNRVAIAITESWEATIDNRNYLTIKITTTLNSVVRDDLRGANQDSPGRYINIYREEGSSPVLSLTDTQAGTAHTIWTGPITLAEYTFTLAPGQSAERSSLFVHNQTIGAVSYDDIWAGVQFLNDLPKETIPHAVLGPNDQWLSHNRDGGDLRLYNNGKWSDNLANTGGGEDYGDPPSVMKNDKWLNARTFGRE